MKSKQNTLINKPLDFMIQLNKTELGISNYELYIPYIGGEKVTLDYVKQPVPASKGYIIGLSNGSTTIEVGNKDDLLPESLIRQMRSEFGMLLIEVGESEDLPSSRYHLLSMEV